MENTQDDTSNNFDPEKREESLKLLNSNVDYLTKVEYDFLLSHIESGDIKSFRENFWHFFKLRKIKNDNTYDVDFKKNQFEAQALTDHKIKKLTAELEKVHRNLTERMSRLVEAEEMNRMLTLQNKNLEKSSTEKSIQLNESAAKIKTLEGINADLQSKVQQERIDEKIPTYVNNVKSELGSDDTHFVRMSIIWAIAGVLFGVAAVSMSIYTLFLKVDFNNIKNAELFYIFSRGLIGIAILSWLSYICLGNSKKYTHESIRRKDRRHALMFGQVYLQIYGATASKEDAILVFKDWNMSGDSAFSGQTEQPPNVLSFFSNAKEKFKSSYENKEAN